MTEEWRKVVGYEGVYEVSSLGNIKRVSGFRSVNKKYLDGYILKPMNNGKGYMRVKLTIKNKAKRVMVHRIMAKAFISNPDNKPYINHINSIRSDNRLENLEWCTQSENVLHSVKMGRWGALAKNRKPL